MKKQLEIIGFLLFIFLKTLSQDLLPNVDYLLMSKASLTTTITKDTSWVSQPVTGGRGINRSGVFQTIPGYRITNVEFKCDDYPNAKGTACPWNYNPTGGYSKNITINDCGNSAMWSRRYDGAACTQRYTITFKKIEVEDFWKKNLKFITDSIYNPDSKVFLENSSSLPVTIRYKVEYSIGSVLHSSQCNILVVAAYSKQYIGPKYIRNNDGNFIINYEIIEAPY